MIPNTYIIMNREHVTAEMLQDCISADRESVDLAKVVLKLPETGLTPEWAMPLRKYEHWEILVELKKAEWNEDASFISRLFGWLGF